MKIVHVCHVYHPSEGGVQFWFKNVSERLVKDYGDEVTVVTTNSMYGPERRIFMKVEPASEVINGVQVLRFSFRRWHIRPYHWMYKIATIVGIKMPDKMLAKAAGPYSPTMISYLMNVQADVICASSSNYYYMQLPLWRKTNFFYFGSIHLSEDRSVPVLNQLQKRSIIASNLYFANTAYEKSRLQEAGIPAGKIKILGVGVEPSSFNISDEAIALFKSSLHLPADSILLAYVGRIERTKNVHLLIDAFNKLALTHNNVYLLIAGAGGEYANELQQSANNLPVEISGRIKWKLNFATHEKAAIFNAIDMLVLPSNNESFGIVFLEAWICKKPVVGTNIGAIADVIDNHIDGLLFKKDDAANLFEKLQVLIANKAERERLAQNGYRKVMENYTWDIITKKLRQCYTDAATSHHV